MSIFYALIAKEKFTILVDFQTARGNFPQVTQKILARIKPDSQCSYEYNEDYFYHYINFENLTYLCLADADYRISLAFKFLEKLQEKFLAIPPLSYFCGTAGL